MEYESCYWSDSDSVDMMGSHDLRVWVCVVLDRAFLNTEIDRFISLPFQSVEHA